MPLRFSCTGCNAILEVPDEHAGKQVRCGKCQAVSTAWAPSPQPAPALAESPKSAPPPLETVTARDASVTAAPPQSMPAPSSSKTPPPLKSFAEPTSRPLAKNGGSSIMPIALVVGAVAILGVCLIGGAAVTFFSFALIAPNEHDHNVAKAEVAFAPVADLKHEDKEEVKVIGNPNPPWQEPDVPRQVEKPIIVEPPLRIALTDGVFQSKVDFDKNAVRPGTNRPVKRIEFPAKANTVYWVSSKNNFRTVLRVEGPNGFSADPSNNDRMQLAFMTPQEGIFTAIVQCEPFDQLWCNLEIREMDGQVALPEQLKIKAVLPELPKIASAIALNVYEKQFTSAAFSPDGKTFWIAHGDKTLSFWENPGFEKKGEYRYDRGLEAMCVDKHGRLYAQVMSNPTNGPVSIRKRDVGDISVFEKLNPKLNAGKLPAATHTLPIRGIAVRLIHSPDGKWIYYLDTHNRILGRIDVEKVAIDKTIDGVSTSVSNFCLTPDGKRIYCCSSTNRIDVIDTGEFKLLHSVSIDRGQPSDIAATNEGLVFLAGQRGGERFHGNGYVVDLRKKRPDPVTAMPVPIRNHAMFVSMLPDQRGVLFSGDRRVHICSIPAEPAIMAMEHRETWIRDYFVPGQIVVSPDGRTLLQDSGSILSISR